MRVWGTDRAVPSAKRTEANIRKGFALEQKKKRNRSCQDRGRSRFQLRGDDESLTSLAVYFRNWHMFREHMNNIAC